MEGRERDWSNSYKRNKEKEEKEFEKEGEKVKIHK